MEEIIKKEFDRVSDDIKNLKDDIKDNQKDIRTLETRTTINEQNIKTIGDDLNAIKQDTRWILRLIIGTIILSLLYLIMKTP